ncbi:MAG: hypothetical protein AAF960_26875, partial [Bacteroidota bacterium]
MKNTILAIIWLMAAQYIYAQSPYSTAVQGPIAPSAAAMSYGKYADNPINPNNGTMAFGIPLFSVADGPLSHSVSITYHTGGVRVNEISSEIGLGWHLNAGGVISRTVRGLPDDDDKGYFKEGANLTHYGHAPQARDVADGLLDAEPDLFFFHVGGMTGKFVYNELGEIQMIPQSNIQIEETMTANDEIYGFELTAIDGTKYFFGNGQHQSTEVNNGERFYDTWFLYQIVSADGIHQINFNYTPSNYVFYSKQDCHSTHYFDGGQQEAENTCDRDDYNFIEVFGRVLSSITSSYQTITFSTSDRDDLVLHSGGITPKKIDRIGFSDGSHCVEYELTQSYYQDNNIYPNFYFVGENNQQNLSQNTNQPLRKRLRLDQIQKVSCVAGGNETEEPYVFSYHHTNNYFPCLLSKRINHWGFYNGRTINDNLIDLTGPSSVQTPSGGYYLYHGSADRRTDEEAMKTGMLYKVTYPTKGFTQLNYEANRYADYETNQQSVNNFPIETCSTTNSSACCVDISPATTQEITVPLDEDMIETGEIYLTAQNDGTEVNCTPGHNFARVTIYDSANDYVAGFSTNIYGVHDEETIQKNIKIDFPQLTVGTYKFVLEASFARGELDIRYTPNYTEELAGGFRIKEIITGEGAAPDNDKDIKRTFTYQLDNGTPSGALVNKPTYGFIIDQATYGNFGHTGIFTSTGVLPLSGSDGNHIYYRQVNEYFNGNGHKKYTIFYDAPNYVPDFPVAPAKFIAKNGTLDKEKVYKEDGTLELTKNIFDNPVNNITKFITGVKHRSARIKRYNGTSVIDDVTSAGYTMHTGIYRPDGVTTTIDGVTSTTDYDYHSDNNLILPPTKMTTTNSDGKVTEITTSYSVDYDGDGSIKNYFTTNNIIGIPYKTEKRVDGELLDGTRTIYSSFGGFPRPASTERYERTWASNGQLMGGEWKPQELFLNYNSAGLLSQYQKIG